MSHLASPLRMMTRMQAILSHSELITLQFSMMLLRILLGFSSVSSLSYLSRMKSVYNHHHMYNLVNGHSPQDSVRRKQQEIILLHFQVEHDHFRNAAQVWLQFSLKLVLVILSWLYTRSSTLYSNWPMQRDKVHLPISRSYWMNPPACSIRILSSPLLGRWSMFIWYRVLLRKRYPLQSPMWKQYTLFSTISAMMPVAPQVSAIYGYFW